MSRGCKAVRGAGSCSLATFLGRYRITYPKLYRYTGKCSVHRTLFPVSRCFIGQRYIPPAIFLRMKHESLVCNLELVLTNAMCAGYIILGP